MLGIFLILCLTVYAFIRIKVYHILKDDSFEPEEIGSEVRTFRVCNRAIKLNALSLTVALIGYLGCAFPFLFIQDADIGAYITGIVMFGFAPVLACFYLYYLLIRNSQGYIKISTEEIEYKRHKSFSVKINDIRKIKYVGMDAFQIYLKEKGKKSLCIRLHGFRNKKQIYSLMKQLREHSDQVSGRDKSLVYKLRPWRFEMIMGKYYPALCKIVIVLLLLYTSYCCIDYDFFRKDYTTLYNNLNADSSQPENAWEHYVQAVVNYVELDDEFQDVLEDISDPNQSSLTDSQKDTLKKWFKGNTFSWKCLKKAVTIDYCNATYEYISLSDSTDQDDFSSPSDDGYHQIKDLYHNANAGRLVGIIDIDWFDLFQMQLSSSEHFINGKSIMDQLVGYAMLARSVNFLSKQDSYELVELENARNKLSEHFPVGIPPLDIEGEILISCSSFDGMINDVKIPTQTPLNPMFLALGSSTGTAEYAHNHYTAILDQAQRGIEVESESISIIGFPIIRKMMFSILDPSIARIHEISQRADAYLLAAYFLLDLEEYQLMKGCYPVDVSQLLDAGLTSQLPNDPYTDGKIIYSNDGQRAVLYAVGRNGKDDGGYKDPKKSDGERDDIIFWERKIK